MRDEGPNVKHGSRTADLDAKPMKQKRTQVRPAQAKAGGTRRELARVRRFGTAAGGRTKPEALRLMEAAVERSNMLCAYERVVKNEGAPGVDGLTVAEFKPWLQAHWPSVRQALLAGEYMPAAVRKVDIPKPQGGVRTLGIPTVLDRLIQQALHQVMQPLFEPEFSESSYGFRPGRNAQQAVKAARDYVAEGRRWVVDLDLEKFFDRVNHDVLMARVVREGEGRTGVEADPALSGSGTDGRRGGECANGRHAARRATVAAVVQHPADRSGPRTGEARASLLPLCGRLQHLCRKPAERAAGDERRSRRFWSKD